MIILPQEGIGGCTPKPRKLKPASIKMAEAKLAAEITITGLIILGKICFVIILKSLYPNALPASKLFAPQADYLATHHTRHLNPHGQASAKSAQESFAD